jgi:transposase-like protein
MKKSRFTESQIIGILKEVEAGRTGLEVHREHGISEQTLYRWKKKYGGMEASELLGDFPLGGDGPDPLAQLAKTTLGRVVEERVGLIERAEVDRGPIIFGQRRECSREKRLLLPAEMIAVRTNELV